MARDQHSSERGRGSHGGTGVGQWGGEASFQDHTSLQRDNDNLDLGRENR